MKSLAAFSVVIFVVPVPEIVSAQTDDVDFVRDIRPILSENCVFCHGPDEAERHADLRLDTEEGALSVLTRSHRDQSDLFDRITTDDSDSSMPPPDANRKLTAKQIELIGQWIDQGAKWEKHWSFRAIEKPDVPEPRPLAYAPVRNSIDAFVQQRLGSSPLDPSAVADKRTLIRRLTLDLTGLPPTPEETEAFVADESDDAYDQLVQRLLSSSAYGQRMAWDWLDAARYADTNGYQGDRERTMWPWRDWVVRAFNDNMPYDQFTVWQLAGDQLPNATEEQRLATGFCRNHMINGEGGRIAEENRVEYVMDMSETMGTVWLGLTLNCCRCHDHKYDPITNKEYYQFFAFFNQTPVKGNGGDPATAPNLSVPSAKQAETIRQLDRQISDADKKLRQLSVHLSEQQSAWERRRAAELSSATEWERLAPHQLFSQRQRMRLLGDASILTAGANPAKDVYRITSKTELKSITGIRVEALRHDTMTKGGLARSDSGNFVLTGFEVALIDPKDEDRRIPIVIESAEATFEQGNLTIGKTFDNDPTSGWAVYEGRPIDRDHAAVWRFRGAVDIPDGMQVEVLMRHESVHKNHNIGRFRLSLTSSPEPKLSTGIDALVTAMRTPPDKRTDAQAREIAKAHRESNPEYRDLKKKRDGFATRRTNVRNASPKVMVMEDMAIPRETFVLTRGAYNKPTDEKVTRAFPDFIPKPKSGNDDSNRLELARWLVSDTNPLTARVTVNRFWQQFFGIGLVKTTEDFGRQGEIPPHMDLLNWLAADFRENGWDVKELIRKIVTSHTYRQSSKISASAYEADPHNRLLARGARFRMPSWMLRDQALAISGLLSTVSTGPSVNTYQPPGIWEEASFGKKTYKQDSGEKLYRRSLFTFWRRIISPTMFFDNATRQSCTVKSSRTNTPLHALQTLNNVAYVESARVLAELALNSNETSDSGRVQYVVNRVLARDATDQELGIFLAGLDRTRKQFQFDLEAATRLVALGESERDAQVDPVEHACWTSLCLAILNLDETLTRE